MKTSLKTLFFVPFFLLSLSAKASQKAVDTWNGQPGLSQTQIQELEPSTNFSKSSPLTIVLLRNSAWSREEAIARIRRTEEVFSQCKLSLRPITIVSVANDKGPMVDVDKLEDFLPLAALTRQHAIEKPVIVLADRAQDESYEGGLAVRAGAVGAGSSLVNVAFLFHSFAQEPSRSYPLSLPSRKGFYEVMAHELGHLLFDKPHLPSENNLMSVHSQRTNDIEDWECALIGAPPRNPGGSVSTF